MIRQVYAGREARDERRSQCLGVEKRDHMIEIVPRLIGGEVANDNRVEEHEEITEPEKRQE